MKRLACIGECMIELWDQGLLGSWPTAARRRHRERRLKAKRVHQ